MASPLPLALLLAVAAGDGGSVRDAGISPAARARLTVVVSGIAESRGQLLVTVFHSAQGWPKAQHAAASARVPARAGTQEVRFEDLPPGPCAVSVVHDLDGNGKLTMRWFPYPRPAEPTAASNGATGTLGPPSFERARFELPVAGETIRLALAPP
jgi:uncharacterized protein (DUF2141 family)